jgi:2-C-methyl-D-erythritol 2,4-cyclodiphosphate synthase
MRVGQGYDAHRFGEAGSADSIRLGGIAVPCDRELIAHSDGDVIIHALCDALLGAAGLGDIGQHFPDSDPQYQDVDSVELLEEVVNMLARRDFGALNADITLIAQAPRIFDFKDDMRVVLARLLGVEPEAINIKATTTEGMGFIGRKEGLAALATVLIE